MIEILYTDLIVFVGDAKMDLKFTRDEISRIEKTMGFIVFDWAKYLINHIISQARDAGVDTVYMNTPETLDAGAITEGKTDYFYDKLPPLLGFAKEEVNLRGKGLETLWAFHINTKTASSNIFKIAKEFSLVDIPQTYQGAFINIVGKKPYYTEEDVQKVVNILNKKDKKNKIVSKFYYDWGSRKWTGSQRFNPSITENVVLQKLPSEAQDLIQRDPALVKFWSFVLSQHQHFGNDVIGFALISKISPKIWVINEIQTDCINAYMKVRRIDKEVKEREEKITMDTLKDMMEAQNRSKWIPKIEQNEKLRNQLLENPNNIQNLPDNSHDIDAWIKEQLQLSQTNDATRSGLAQYLASVNFNTRIFRR